MSFALFEKRQKEDSSVDNKPRSSTVLKPDEAAYDRYCQRLKEDLGVDDETVEIIVNLRNQVMILQTRLRTLEATLEIHQVGRTTRLTRYREVFQEADWEDM
jgi:hypothetical protein